MSTNTTVSTTDFEEPTRTVADDELSAGESTTVEVVLETEEGEPVNLDPGELVRIDDSFSPGFDDVEVVSFEPGGGNAGAGEDNEELIAVWNDEAERYAVTYEVTMPADPGPDGAVDITGTFEVGDQVDSLPSATISAAVPDETSLELRPADATATIDAETVFGVAVVAPDEGISAFDIEVSLTDTAIAEFSDYELNNVAATDDSTVAVDGSSVTLDVDLEDNHEADFDVPVADLVVETGNAGTTDLTVDTAVVTDTNGEDYDLETIEGATLTVQDNPLCEYTNADGAVGTGGLRDSIDDWRSGEIETDLLRDVIDHWRSGEPVEGC